MFEINTFGILTAVVLSLWIALDITDINILYMGYLSDYLSSFISLTDDLKFCVYLFFLQFIFKYFTMFAAIVSQVYLISFVFFSAKSAEPHFGGVDFVSCNIAKFI